MVHAGYNRFRRLMRRGSLIGLIFLSASSHWTKKAPSAEQVPSDRKGIDFFEAKIRPVLVSKCYACHSQNAVKSRKLKGKLLLDSKSGMLSGGESGPAVVPGKSAGSLIVDAIRHKSLKMPPKEKLPENVIADFVKWIDMGAPDPRGAAVVARALDRQAARAHWAFRPLQKPSAPAIGDDWARTAIDRFILAELHERKLTPTPPTDRRTLIRRVSFDLIGLPPSLPEVQKFVNDASESAYEDLVDRLLKNAHYGERWARHWLDVARFGESEGSNPEEDKKRDNAYKYRDAVIKAFNEDLPYHEFVSYQVAGRDLDNRSPLARDLAQFVELGTRLQRNSHPNDSKFHILDDMVSATGSAFLGITIGCARCHDHKLDPITTEEYYRLTAVFFDLANVTNKVGVNTIPILREPHLLAGGNWQRPVKKVKPGFVQVLMRGKYRSDSWLSGEAADGIAANSGPVSPRQALARWLTDVDRGAGGLLARVIVNRVWQHHFGRGIVSTPNDFGRLGEPPSHPKLLDWLAGELIRGGWRLKPLHRLIMVSAAYRQAGGDRWAKVDRDSKWIWHYRTRRLEAEAIRDNILSVSGALKTDMFGPSIAIGSSKKPYQEKPAHWRRSVYLMTPRFQTHPVLRMFDPAGTFQSLGTRSVSTTPRGALFMLNAPFLWKQADLLADRVEQEAGAEPAAQVDFLYELALSRAATTEERSLGVAFLEHTGNTEEKGGGRQLVHYCHAIMGLNEFIYIR
ncbi:MAG: PSD1 and planctomycete cytochrome C domain-containing protein [Pirellulales bacterium]